MVLLRHVALYYSIHRISTLLFRIVGCTFWKGLPFLYFFGSGRTSALKPAVFLLYISVADQ